MNTGWVSKRWFGAMLLIALFSLLAAIALQARLGHHDVRFSPEPVIRGFSRQSTIQPSHDTWAVEYEMTGNELGLASAGSTGVKQFQFVSAGEGALDYLFERESAEYSQIVRAAPRPAIQPSHGTWAVDYEMTGNELGLDSVGSTGVKQFQFASAGEGALDYLFEREGAEHTQDAGGTPRPACQPLQDPWVVEYEMTGNELDLDTTVGTRWRSFRFAPLGDGYLEYLAELETVETDR